MVKSWLKLYDTWVQMNTASELIWDPPTSCSLIVHVSDQQITGRPASSSPWRTASWGRVSLTWHSERWPNHLVVARGSTLQSGTNFLLVPLWRQAGRARQLGATVYCVGVKDFNETQVSRPSSEQRSRFVISGSEPVSRLPCSSPPSPTARITSSRSTMASRLCRESSTRWGNMAAHLHRMWTWWNVTLSTVFNASHFPLFFQILRRSCIEILAVEPSSICEGGKASDSHSLCFAKPAHCRFWHFDDFQTKKEIGKLYFWSLYSEKMFPLSFS